MVEKDGFKGDVTGSGEMKEGISGKRLGIGGGGSENGSGDEFAEGAGFASEI
jgi:hypothetical protein